jgi:hypothetical protein
MYISPWYGVIVYAFFDEEKVKLYKKKSSNIQQTM